MTRRIEPASRLIAGPLSMLHRACFPEDPWNPAAMTDIMDMAGFFGRVAWEDERPVGFALALDLGKECEILSLGVVSERRRAGIGPALLEAVTSEARLRGAEYIVLEVAANNVAALALYVTYGFTQIGRRRSYYQQGSGRVDALVLRMALAATTAA